MKAVTINCDRCGKVVSGKIGICPTSGDVITKGYYIVSDGNWSEFARWEEEIICDDCMHIDPKYLEIYK